MSGDTAPAVRCDAIDLTRLATLYGTRASPSSDAIHAFIEATKDVDARDKRGHDGRESDSI
jgi:hypothetical protein